MNQEEFYKSWQFLADHKIFKEQFLRALDIEVVKVNPASNHISENEEENTKIQVWLECGPWEDNLGVPLDANIPNSGFTHDIDLDCGGETFEEAIIRLADLVKIKYGK